MNTVNYTVDGEKQEGVDARLRQGLKNRSESKKGTTLSCVQHNTTMWRSGI
jgi:hypothetical protein